jgi:GDPmannose 4,6-dehydratase
MRALICGVSGQDGAYLAQLLLERGYEVIGTSRRADADHIPNLEALSIAHRVRLRPLSLEDFAGVHRLVAEIEPDEIYNLAGQSSVGLSFDQPLETWHSIATGTLNLLEAIRRVDAGARLFNAASGECFGDMGEAAAHESTPFRPQSPYAAAKAAAFWAVANYRAAYGIYACSGLLFNHESPLRGERFVTQKIVKSACRIAAGSRERLRLGNLQVCRDWGWAPEYVEAMWRMLQQPTAGDYVIATGESHSLAEFAEVVFSAVGLGWREHVEFDDALVRPGDPMVLRANPTKAMEKLGWQAQSRMQEVAAMMIEACRHSS